MKRHIVITTRDLAIERIAERIIREQREEDDPYEQDEPWSTASDEERTRRSALDAIRSFTYHQDLYGYPVAEATLEKDLFLFLLTFGGDQYEKGLSQAALNLTYETLRDAIDERDSEEAAS